MGKKRINVKCFCEHALHSLLQDGVSPGLADDQISPLDDHNTGKERRVTGELHDLPALVRLIEKRGNGKIRTFSFFSL